MEAVPPSVSQVLSSQLNNLCLLGFFSYGRTSSSLSILVAFLRTHSSRQVFLVLGCPELVVIFQIQHCKLCVEYESVPPHCWPWRALLHPFLSRELYPMDSLKNRLFLIDGVCS